MKKKTIMLKETDLDNLRDLVASWGENVSYLEDLMSDIDGCDKALEALDNPSLLQEFEIVPGVDYCPGDYQDLLSDAHTKLLKVWKQLDNRLRKTIKQHREAGMFS